ncbi:N-acetyltransferase family protein [Tistrella mobilis]|uniref:GNAT family N-acetyltransferase n=1 Tax=Tistrella mobilis TaxID=171437 RepID=UPI003555EF7D
MTGAEAGEGAGIVIRAAVVADAGRLWALLRDLAVEDGAGARFRATEALVAAHGFGPAPRFQAALAEDAAGRALGFASWFPVYSSFRARDYLLLDNLYVVPAARGGAVARRLIAHVAGHATALGADRLELHVQADNDRARRFYARMGFEATGGMLQMIDGVALDRLAAEAG